MSGRTVHVRACVFGGRFVVTVEPRTVDLPSEEFRAAESAQDRAAALSEVHGWPVTDHTGEAHG